MMTSKEKEYQDRYRSKKRTDPKWKKMNAARQRGYYSRNSKQRNQYDRDRRRDQPGAFFDNFLRSKFGFTIYEYNELLNIQNGGCAICGATQSGPAGRRFAVDHCHKSGTIRGLLCIKCNQGLGQFNDNIELMHGAIKYLMKQEKLA